MSVANRVTYFLEDFILEDGKVGYGGAYLAGKGVVGYAVFVQIPGNLIEVAADPAVLGCQLPDSGKQLVIDRRHMDNRAYGRPPYRLPEKFGLADTCLLYTSHEPIIDTETWERVQELRKQRKRPNRYDEVGLFSGMLFCADCGHVM